MIKKIPENYIKNIILPACNFDKRIAEAFIKIPRHKFVDEALYKLSYKDEALPIGFGQTISKPSTVAKMTYLLNPQPNEKILEIGTGSGFQAAILSTLAGEIYSVERISELYKRASNIIRKLFIRNIRLKIAGSEIGWQDHAPFDKIIVTAEADKLHDELISQLKDGGTMIIPLNGNLRLYKKNGDKLEEQIIENCKFVKFIT